MGPVAWWVTCSAEVRWGFLFLCFECVVGVGSAVGARMMQVKYVSLLYLLCLLFPKAQRQNGVLLPCRYLKGTGQRE